MSNATLQVGGGNWAAQDGKLLGYAVEPTSGRYLAREFTVNRNSSKWVLGSNGYLYEVPADQPALEYYSDGTFRGALVEPASTNLNTRSDNFGASPWIKGGNALINSNATISPDGTTNADRLIDTDVGGTGAVQLVQTFSGLTVGGNYAAQIWVKADGLSKTRIFLQGIDGANSLAAQIDLTDGSVSNKSGVGTFIVNPSIDGYYHIIILFSMGASDSSFGFNIYPVQTDGSVTVDLDGTSSIFIWGMQLEESPIATSYIPTNGSTVTRLKDDISFTNASSVIGQSEGTLFVEVDWQETLGVFQNIFVVSDGTANNRVQIIKMDTDDLYMRLFANNVEITSQGESSTAYSGIQKIAFAYKTNDFELYRNGSSISTDTSGSLASLATLTDVNFGIFVTGQDPANMWIRDARIYNTRLTAAEISQLTVTPSAQQFIFNLSNEVFSTSTLTFS